MVIPRKIHYIWLGSKGFTGLQYKCINSWKIYLPEKDWQYYLWNEETLPEEVKNHPYVKKMTAHGKWSYVSDFIRFWALERYGGIYFDTDVELLKPFDSFLNNHSFVGTSSSGQIESAVIGAMPHAKFLQSALGHYTGHTEDNTGDLGPSVLADAVKHTDEQVKIYTFKYFYPFAFGEKFSKKLVNNETHAIHWWDYSWGSPFARMLIKLHLYKIAVAIKRVISKK